MGNRKWSSVLKPSVILKKNISSLHKQKDKRGYSVHVVMGLMLIWLILVFFLVNQNGCNFMCEITIWLNKGLIIQ